MMVKGSESFSAEEARRVVKAMKAHEREQLREAGQRKMSELRSLKAAVLKAHAAAKLQQQHSEGSVSSTYLTSNPSCESDSTQTLQQQPTSPAQGQQQPSHAAHQLHPQDATPQSVTTSSGSRDRPVSTPGSTAVKGTPVLGLCHSAPGSLGFLQPGRFSTVARAAGAVAAGAAAVAAAAAARAAAADPPAGPMNEDTAVSPAGPRFMQQQVEMQQAQQSTVQQAQQVTPQEMQKRAQEQQQQQELEQQALPSVPDVSFQDPMVDMLLQQVEALMSEKQQLAAKCCGLERENEQLVELVGHLHDTLETAVDMQQQQEGEVDTILEGDAEGVDEDGEGAFAAAGAAGVEGAFAAAAAAEASVGSGCMDTLDDPMLTQSDSPTSTQEGVALEGADIGASAAADGGEGEDAVMVTASLPKIEVAAAAPQDAAMPAAAAATAGAPTDMLTDAPVSSAAAAAAAVAPNQVPTQTAAAAAAAAGLEERVIAQQKQMRVAEWLAHRVHEGSSGGRPPLPAAAAAAIAAPAAAAQSWQQWQEQLPLEAMSSGSSSTLTITLTDP